MHRNTTWVWPGIPTTSFTTLVLGQTEGGYKGREVLLVTLQPRDMDDTGRLNWTDIFNIILDTVIRTTLQEICGHQEAQHGFGWSAGEHNICFYADDGWIAGRDPIWVHTALTKMVRIFERVRFQTNLNITKGMICTPRFIWGQQGAEAYKWRSTRDGPSFRESKRTRVSCEEYGETMAAYSLRHHM